jgi:hypothetical protein
MSVVDECRSLIGCRAHYEPQRVFELPRMGSPEHDIRFTSSSSTMPDAVSLGAYTLARRREIRIGALINTRVGTGRAGASVGSEFAYSRSFSSI